MGSEFLEKTQKTFKRSMDRRRILLATPDLFTAEPTKKMRTVFADIVGGTSIKQGDQFIIEACPEGLVGRIGHTDIVRIGKPPADLLNAVDAACGVALGRVENVHGDADVAEISFR